MTIFREDGDSWGLQKSQIVNERGPSWDISRRQFVQVNIFSVIIAIIIIVVVIWTKAPPGRWLVHVIMRSHELIIAINYVVVVWSKAPPEAEIMWSGHHCCQCCFCCCCCCCRLTKRALRQLMSSQRDREEIALWMESTRAGFQFKFGFLQILHIFSICFFISFMI